MDDGRREIHCDGMGTEDGEGPGSVVDGETTKGDSPEGSKNPLGAKGGRGFVYFVETEDREFVKIGFSKRVHVRMSELGTLRPSSFSFRVLGSISAPAEVERWLHKLFVEDCDNGEWFKNTPRLRSLIEVLNLDPPVERRPRSSRTRRKDKRSLIIHSQETEPDPGPIPEVELSPEPEPVTEVEVQSSDMELSDLVILKCLRCGHQWYPRTPARPKQCPNCKQPKWDEKPRWKGKRKAA